MIYELLNTQQRFKSLPLEFLGKIKDPLLGFFNQKFMKFINLLSSKQLL